MSDECRAAATNTPRKSIEEVFAEVEAYQRAGGWTAVARTAKSIWRDLQDWTPAQLCRRVKWFWQRGRRGWADCDTWSFDYYLSRVIAGGARHMAEHACSYPSDLAQELVRPVIMHDEGDDSVPFEEWKATLREMADGFDAWAADDWETKAERDALREKLERSLDTFRVRFTALWD